MDISSNIEELQEKVYANGKQLQEIADLKHEVRELTEKRTVLNKQIQTAKLSIEQKESVLFAPYMEQTEQAQKTLFD